MGRVLPWTAVKTLSVKTTAIKMDLVVLASLATTALKLLVLQRFVSARRHHPP